MGNFNQLDSPVVGLVVLLVRLTLGLLLAAHGAQKLLGWFRGPGLHDTAAFLEQLGFRPGRVFAAAAGLTELTGGLLIAIGFLGPVGPALLLSVMVVAVVTVHWGNGLLATSNGSELPILYSAGGISLAFLSAGPFSLDAWLGIPSAPVWLISAVLAAGALGGLFNAFTRRPLVTNRALGSATLP